MKKYLFGIAIIIFGVFLSVNTTFSASILLENFGTGSDVNPVPGWENNSGPGSQLINPGSGNDSASSDGGRFALVRGNNGYICKFISTIGQNNIKLSYEWRGDDQANSNDLGIVEFKPVSGPNECETMTGWTTLQSHDLSNSGTWTTQAGFNNPGFDNSSFHIRFRADTSNPSKDFRIDKVHFYAEVAAPTVGNIQITKYACPEGVTVVRSANGVGKTVPAGCIPEAGKTFGYVHGTQTDANSPYPELSAPVTPAGTTDINGILTISDLSTNGRYLIVETNPANPTQKLPHEDVLGLYCTGDGDTTDTNDNQELTFVQHGQTTHCVAYNTDNAPDAFNVSPADGTTATGTSLTQTWGSNANDINYFLYESYHDSLGTNLRWSETISGTSKTATNVADATFWWRVKAVDLIGNMSDWTPLWKLIVSNTSSNTVIVTKNTSLGENQPGWMFNRDLATSTPYEFNMNQASIGSGSLYVKPIGANPADKFIAENFLNKPISDVKSIAYDFMIGSGGEASDAGQFYMNVYANFGVSDDLKFYDCRYNVVPTVGSTGGFTTVTFDPNMSYPVTTRTGGSASPFTCPNIPAQMDTLSPGSNIRVFALNLGDTSASDTGLDGYFDKVVVKVNNVTTTYDFEKFLNTGLITNPTLNQVVSGTINLTATYNDGDDVNDDAVNWAVRKNTCSANTNTVFGNVDGFNNTFSWDGKNFSSSLDTTTLDNGTYCFVFNPTDGPGENDVRETVMFTIDNTIPVPPVVNGTLIVKKVVVNNENGTKTAGDFSFKINGGDSIFFNQDIGNPLLGENTFVLPIGTYDITEDGLFYYAALAENCTNIVVTEDSTATCTFTNDDFIHSGGGPSGPSTSSSNGVGVVAGASTENTSENSSQEPVGQVLGESTCSAIYLNDFLAFGKKNSPDQVKLLQIFLNEELGLNLAIDGKFGQQTKKAVIAFQEKYASEILTPWSPFGLKSGKGTGYVYKTTKWKINMLKCSDLKLEVPQLP